MDADAYLEARSYEREAREEEKKGSYETAIALWRSYAELKESKGSYFLCMYGYFNAARICDAVHRWKEAAESFETASTFAERIGERSLWAFFMSLACQMHEKAGDYEVPVDAWRKNYEYWKEQGELDDAEWSLKRIDAYRAIQNKV